MATTNYSYSLNGTPVHTNDPILTGRDIRSQGNLVPASDHVLIEIGERTSRSIGLEEQITLREGAVPELWSFESDRVFSFIINERGFEWGADEISATDVRRYGKIPDDHDLVLDSKGDRPIPDDGVIRLKPKGVERVRSQPAQTVCIVVNTRQKHVPSGTIAFAELTALAFPDAPHGPNTAFTVSFRKGTNKQPEGTLVDGEDIRIKEGMVFNVSATDKS